MLLDINTTDASLAHLFASSIQRIYDYNSFWEPVQLTFKSHLTTITVI